MNSNAVKELMYGGIHQLMKNRQYYYHSAVGASYCHWTEEGKEALADYINLMGHKLLEAEEIELNQRAKNLVINALKGEQV